MVRYLASSCQHSRDRRGRRSSGSHLAAAPTPARVPVDFWFDQCRVACRPPQRNAGPCIGNGSTPRTAPALVPMSANRIVACSWSRARLAVARGSCRYERLTLRRASCSGPRSGSGIRPISDTRLSLSCIRPWSNGRYDVVRLTRRGAVDHRVQRSGGECGATP